MSKDSENFIQNNNKFLCCIELSNVNARLTDTFIMSHSVEVSLWSLQITITMTEGALLIFLQSGVEKFVGTKPTTLDLGSQSSGFDLSAKKLNLFTFQMMMMICV